MRLTHYIIVIIDVSSPLQSCSTNASLNPRAPDHAPLKATRVAGGFADLDRRYRRARINASAPRRMQLASHHGECIGACAAARIHIHTRFTNLEI